MTQRDDDLRMLLELLDQHADDLTAWKVQAFADMRFELQVYGGILDGETARKFEKLTDRQRSFVVTAHERVVPQYANLVSRGLVPRGREVETPDVLKRLPSKPPRRKDD